MFIYDTLKKAKSKFEPKDNHVKMYVCGITVYDSCHIGHARMFLVFDTVVRYLKSRNYKVTYIRNITDIDDKIIKKAIEMNVPANEIAEKYTAKMLEDEQNLNLLKPDKMPKATEYIKEMISFISNLIEKNNAYVGKNGDVFYSISSFDGYGKVSGKKLDELQAGHRVDVDAAKQNPLDFVLWKKAKDGEPSWDSPWGKGRPGWHIECSTMALHCLDETFDIHGGGHDLMFPHHENECAQSEAHNGKEFVKNWMHVGYLQIDKEKMSKSEGNFITIKEILKNFHPEILRFLMINSHYRSPVEYSDSNIEKASQSLNRLYTTIRGISYSKAKENTEYEKNFFEAMDDDFNTPKAISVLFELAKDINIKKETEDVSGLVGLLVKLSQSIGILCFLAEEFFQYNTDSSFIENLIKERNQARKNKDFKRADEIRSELSEKGIVLEDTSKGTLWKKI